MTDSRSMEDIQWSRRRFLAGVGAAGIATGANMVLSGSAFADGWGDDNDDRRRDVTQNILNAAATAEALASVMYDQMIQSSLYTQYLANNANDQAYLAAAREEESIHYMALTGAGGNPLALTFYFPVGMFSTASGGQSLQTVLNTLITLEDAFIAAYLIGVHDFPHKADRVIAAQILGIESEHRSLGRVIASDVGLTSVTGLSGQPESVVAPNHAVNNIAFERTFSNTGPMLKNIHDVVKLLGPFVTPPSAGSGFDPTPYSYNSSPNYYLSENPSVMLDSTTP